MKRNIASVAAVLVFAGLLTGGVLFSHRPASLPQTADVVSPSPSDTVTPSPDTVTQSPTADAAPTPSQAPAAPAPKPTQPPVATVQNPLPSPSPSPDPTPAPTPDPSASPSPSPSPSPVQAPPPPPVCIWSVSVQTLANDGSGGWANLGTWNGSTTSGTVTSPIFITGVLGWLQYTYNFSDACSGHASITSYYVFSGDRIYTDSAGTSTRQANIPAATQVDFVVTVT